MQTKWFIGLKGSLSSESRKNVKSEIDLVKNMFKTVNTILAKLAEFDGVKVTQLTGVLSNGLYVEASEETIGIIRSRYGDELVIFRGEGNASDVINSL